MLRSYFGIENGGIFEHFAAPVAMIRKKLGDAADHGTELTCDDFKVLRMDIFRILDLAAWMARLPLIFQPTQRRHGFIEFTNLNTPLRSRNEIAYANLSRDIPRDTIFTIFPGGKRLIPLGAGVRLKRDKETNRPGVAICGGP